MRAAEARRAGFTPPRRTVSKLVLAAWEACSEAWMADSLYDTAKRIGASDTVLSEAYVALERASRDLSETGRASLYELQQEDESNVTRICVAACAALDQRPGVQEALL